MSQPKNINNSLKKAGITIVVITLIIGILSSAFGFTVFAMRKNDSVEKTESNVSVDDSAMKKEKKPEKTEFPTKGYDLKNEISLNDDVKVLSEADSNDIISSITSVESEERYYGNYLEVTLTGENHDSLSDIYGGDIIYLQGKGNELFDGDQLLKINDIYSYDNQTEIRLTTPSFEEVFNNVEVASSDILTEDNLVSSDFAEGVKAHFGKIEDEFSTLSDIQSIGDEKAQTLASAQETKPTPMTSDVETDDIGDLIVDIDYKFKEKDNETSGTKSSFGIKGAFGLKDLAAHFICDMPSITDVNELYFGVSGKFVVDIDLYGKIEGKLSEEDNGIKKNKKKLIEISGLDNKRFPMAVFQFKGSTPVYITNKAFEKSRKSILPTIYIVVYADWQGEISFEWNGGFEYTKSFNNGLRVFKNGQPHLAFESYPYVGAYETDSSSELVVSTSAKLSADVELTALGGSVLFYVAGINFGEISIARIGVQIEGEISVSGDTKDGFKFIEPEDTKFYIKCFLNIIEVKVKLKLEGNKFLKNLSTDLNFDFSLITLTIFEKGHQPDKYRWKVPVSSMEAPTDFESVMSLVCDVSGSMDSSVSTGESKLDALRQAGKSIVSMTEGWAKNNNGNFGLGIIQFDDVAETVSIPHIDYKFLNECFDTIGRGGGTNITDGLEMSISQLENVDSENKVIILMTDGQHNSGGDPMDQTEIAKEKDIKIYTIGFGSGVNETLLKDIADTTGGEYKFANTDNIIGIISGFMYAQQAANATVLTEQQGTVAQDETTKPSKFKVSDENGNLTVSTAWPGSFLDTILVDPNGREVDESYPGSAIDESKIPSSIIVKNPIPGKWSVRIKGVETSYEQEPYYTIVSFKKTKNIKINKPLNTLETVASYCIPIGLFTTLVSVMLLVVLIKKKTKDN